MKNIKLSIEEKVVGVKNTSRVFMNGVKEQLDSDGTWIVAGYCGVATGIRYSGSIKRGAITTVAIAGGLSVLNGVRTAYQYNRLTKRCK